MNCNPTLTAEEFKTVHNALWELDSVTRQLEGILNPELYAKLARAGSTIRVGLKGAYEQDNDAFDRKNNHYEKIQSQSGFKTIWSIYEVEDLEADHPFTDALQVAYKDHWGDEPVFVEIQGMGTWVDLWRAADEAIRRSGDQHHIFIEQFRPNPKNPQQLLLTTGS